MRMAGRARAKSGEYQPADDLDVDLVEALRKDGRQSNTALGRQLGTSNVTVRNRLRRLVKAGLVRVVPVVNLERWGFGISVLLLLQAQPSEIQRLAQALSREPAVRTVRITSGLFDLAVDASFRNHEELADFLRVLNGAPGVLHIQSNHVIENLKTDADWIPPYRRGDQATLVQTRIAEGGSSVLWTESPLSDQASSRVGDLKVAATWLRALLRGDLTALSTLSADDIVVDVAGNVPLTGRHLGREGLVEHARTVVREYPLIDSRILHIRPGTGPVVEFITEATGITADGRYVNDRHLIRATVRRGKIATVDVTRYEGPVPPLADSDSLQELR